jgi:hypothetical protein
MQAVSRNITKCLPPARHPEDPGKSVFVDRQEDTDGAIAELPAQQDSGLIYPPENETKWPNRCFNGWH